MFHFENRPTDKKTFKRITHINDKIVCTSTPDDIKELIKSSQPVSL